MYVGNFSFFVHSISVHMKTQHFKANSSRDFNRLLHLIKDQDLFSSTSSSVNAHSCSSSIRVVLLLLFNSVWIGIYL